MRDDIPMTKTTAPLDAISNALAALDMLSDDNASLAIRDAMINDPSPAELPALAADYDFSARDIAPILDAIRRLSRDDLSILRLSFSLCPIHSIDYAICFDDDDADCAQIRAAFPSHDT